MPVTPSGDAVEPLMRAVHQAHWVSYDDVHRLLFVGRITDRGCVVHSYDIVTGAEHDAPWPIDVGIVASLGADEGFSVAVAERMARGY